MTDAALPVAPTTQSYELDSPARRARRRLFKRKAAVFGLVVITAFILLAVLAPLVVPYDPIATSWSLVRKPPTAAHWFGTDELGRDILSRIIYGARASLMAGLISVAIALGIGVPLGLLAGYRGGHHRRGRAVLPRPRPAAAGTVLGQHAQRGPALPDPGAVDGDLAGTRDLPGGAVAEPARRRPARCARSKAAVTPEGMSLA